ncbi:MAG: DUF4293 domain-containing protein [Alistipes sp.]|jgi:hypothetical protein|nr:DUF4293 domain-containing protein [Alistipes sp.]
MIQRVQTLWMVATAGLVAGAALIGGGWSGEGLGESFWLLLISGLAALVPLVVVFLFRNRSRQVSMLIAEFALLVGCAGFMVYGAWVARTAWVYSPVLVFLALGTNWLALRGVLRDEMLVRGADRIR